MKKIALICFAYSFLLVSCNPSQTHYKKAEKLASEEKYDEAISELDLINSESDLHKSALEKIGIYRYKNALKKGLAGDLEFASNELTQSVGLVPKNLQKEVIKQQNLFVLKFAKKLVDNKDFFKAVSVLETFKIDINKELNEEQANNLNFYRLMSAESELNANNHENAINYLLKINYSPEFYLKNENKIDEIIPKILKNINNSIDPKPYLQLYSAFNSLEPNEKAYILSTNEINLWRKANFLSSEDAYNIIYGERPVNLDYIIKAKIAFDLNDTELIEDALDSVFEDYRYLNEFEKKRLRNEKIGQLKNILSKRIGQFNLISKTITSFIPKYDFSKGHFPFETYFKAKYDDDLIAGYKVTQKIEGNYEYNKAKDHIVKNIFIEMNEADAESFKNAYQYKSVFDDTAIIGKLNIKISHGEGCGSWAYAAQGVGLASTATDTLEDCQASRADYAGLIGNDGVSDCVCFEKTKGTVELTYKPTFVVLAFNNHIIHEPVNLDSEQINVSLSMKK